MILSDKDAVARLSSPMNLINKMKTPSSRSGAMSLFGIGLRPVEQIKEELIEEVTVTFNPFQPSADFKEELQPSLLPQLTLPSSTTTLDNILENHDSQIKLGLAHDKALELLNRSVEMLSTKLSDIKADKLPAVVSAASKTVESIRRERNEFTKLGKDREVHYHFYTPTQKTVSDYEVIDVTA